MRDLYTKAGEALRVSNETPWQEYPRPRMVRGSFINLNGWWDFSITSDTRPPARFDRKIRVPFVPESLLSGIHEPVPDDSTLWYHKELQVAWQAGQRVHLHVGAADQTVVIWVNGKRAPLVSGMTKNGYTHEGGYEPFTADITNLLQDGRGDLLIQVHDHLGNYKMPYGKQSLNRGGMWYTPCSGIWQTVWIELVPERYIRNVRTFTERQMDGSFLVTVTAEGVEEGTLEFDGNTFDLEDGQTVLEIPEPRLWSPESPYLYRFTIRTDTDAVESYFSLRTLKTAKVNGIPRMLLNERPYFFHGLLDQGYWPDGLFTAPGPESIRKEIARIKKLGFNMVRKHIKVEPEIFYYECDRQGLAVFQDMVQNGAYNYMRETILPTVGIISRNDRKLHTDAESRENFVEGMLSTVRQLKEHPSVVYWTIFNEGWGQFNGTEMYMQLKKEDATRWIDTASGWFHYRGLSTDVESKHIYFGRLKVDKSRKPFVLSEFGGYAWQPAQNCFNPDNIYGYKKFAEKEECERAICQLYEKQILPLIKKGLCAAVYTQVSDVEDETNGLFSYDRKIQKVTAVRMAEIAQALKEAMDKEG